MNYRQRVKRNYFLICLINPQGVSVGRAGSLICGQGFPLLVKRRYCMWIKLHARVQVLLSSGRSLTESKSRFW